MANDISMLYRLLLLLIFKILYFAQQIVPIEINPPSWADSCCDNSRHPPPCLSSRSHTKPRANPHQPAPSVVDPLAADLPPSNPRQSLRPASASATAELILYSSNSSSILGRRCPTFPTVEPTNIPYPSPLSLSLFFLHPSAILRLYAFTFLVSLAICQYFSTFYSPCSTHLDSTDRFVKLLIFFLALRPRSRHPFVPCTLRIYSRRRVGEKYQARCVNRSWSRSVSSTKGLFADLWICRARSDHPVHPRHHERLAVLRSAVCWSRDATVIHDT